MDELLMSIKEARDYSSLKKLQIKKAAQEIDAEKERVRGEMMATAAQRPGNDDSDEASPASDSIDPSGRPRKAQKTNAGVLAFGEMEWFSLHLKDADLARAVVDRDRLNFER